MKKLFLIWGDGRGENYNSKEMLYTKKDTD